MDDLNAMHTSVCAGLCSNRKEARVPACCVTCTGRVCVTNHHPGPPRAVCCKCAAAVRCRQLILPPPARWVPQAGGAASEAVVVMCADLRGGAAAVRGRRRLHHRGAASRRLPVQDVCAPAASARAASGAGADAMPPEHMRAVKAAAGPGCAAAGLRAALPTPRGAPGGRDGRSALGPPALGPAAAAHLSRSRRSL